MAGADARAASRGRADGEPEESLQAVVQQLCARLLFDDLHARASALACGADGGSSSLHARVAALEEKSSRAQAPIHGHGGPPAPEARRFADQRPEIGAALARLDAADAHIRAQLAAFTEHAKQNEAQAARLQQLEAALRDKEDAWARVDEVADSVRGLALRLENLEKSQGSQAQLQLLLRRSEDVSRELQQHEGTIQKVTAHVDELGRTVEQWTAMLGELAASGRPLESAQMEFPSSGWMPQYDVPRVMQGMNFAPNELRDPVMKWMDTRLSRLEQFGERPASPYVRVEQNQTPRFRDPPPPPSLDQWMSVWSKVAPPGPLSVDEVRSLGKPPRRDSGISNAGPLARRIRR